MMTSFIAPSSRAGMSEAKVAGNSFAEFRVGIMIDSMEGTLSIVVLLSK